MFNKLHKLVCSEHMEFDVLSFISLDIKVISLVSAAVFAVVILHVYYSSYHFIKRVFG